MLYVMFAGEYLKQNTRATLHNCMMRIPAEGWGLCVKSILPLGSSFPQGLPAQAPTALVDLCRIAPILTLSSAASKRQREMAKLMDEPPSETGSGSSLFP